jgi:hypothetical protein
MLSLMEKTRVTKAHSKFKGFKTTIPLDYAKELKLEHKDGLIWELKTMEGKKVLVVRKDTD